MFYNNLIAGSSSGGFYPHELEQSLRFNDDDSAYLSWTPTSTGNTKTHTLSFWFKFGNIGTDKGILGSRNGATFRQVLYFTDFHKLQFYTNTNGTIRQITTDQVFRDASAWYHIVLAVDTTQATDSNRAKIYVNGEQVSVTGSYPNQDAGLQWSNTVTHYLGAFDTGSAVTDGYLAEVNFIDGQALDPTDFGEFKSGVWVAKSYTGTYGTNGFYLPFKPTVQAEGFNTVTWAGNTSTQSIEGVGFSPDLVWIKGRSSATSHQLFDTIRGASKFLNSNLTDAEGTDSADRLFSFDGDGFTMGGDSNINLAGRDYVGWCWDAGSGSPVSNTDGSITSSVKASTDYGFSVVSYTGTGGVSTVGHGLSQALDVFIVKNRSSTSDWEMFHSALGNQARIILNSTSAAATGINGWNSTSPTNTVFTLNGGLAGNTSGDDHIAYCWHSVSGVSDFGSYSGGTANKKITTGFKPSMVIVKRTDDTGDWQIFDNTRDTSNPITARLNPNQSLAELTNGDFDIVDDGFELNSVSNESGMPKKSFNDRKEAIKWLDM